MSGYILSEKETNRLGCVLALLWLPLTFPLFFVLLLSGGGCEAKPQPCEPKNWPVFAFLCVVLLLGVSTAWTVKQLRSGARGAIWWIALAVALLLFACAAFVGWLLLQF
jgi:ABC-type transport system involved in cytochrome c biogenesis permease component